MSLLVSRSLVIETWSNKEEDVIRIDRNGAGMVRWTCNVKSEDEISAEELRTRMKLKSMKECLQDRRLQWFVHIERMEMSD